MNRNSALAEETWQPRHSPWLIATSVMLVTFMEIVDIQVSNVSLPHIAGSLSTSLDESTWVLTSYLTANVIIMAVSSWLARFIGRKRYLMMSVLFFTLSSIFCGMATNLPMLIAARFLQGLAGGGLQPLAQAILLESFPKEKRGSAMAFYSQGVILAPVVGPILGGWITYNYSWRWVYYINVPIGIAGMILQQLFVEDPPYISERRAGKIDYIGFSLLTLAIGLFQVILDKGQEDDWFAAPWICWGAAIVVIATIAMIFWELNHKDPIINLRVFLDRNFSLGVILIACQSAVTFGTTNTIPLFLQGLMGYTPLDSGITWIPRGISTFICLPIIGQLLNWIDGRILMVCGFIGVAAANLAFSHINLAVTQMQMASLIFFYGLSLPLITVPLLTMSVATLPQDKINQATGIYSLLRTLGGSSGISILVFMRTRSTQAHYAQLVSHINPFSDEFIGSVHQYNQIVAGSLFQPYHDFASMALKLVARTLLHQAELLAFLDQFRAIILLSLLFVPIPMLFRRQGD